MKVSDYIDDLVTGEAGKLAIADVGDMSLNPVAPPTAIQVALQTG